MGELLHLKGKNFQGDKNHSKGGGPKLPTGKSEKIDHLNSIETDLENVKAFWAKQNILKTHVLLSVYYQRIVPKTRRIDELFKTDAKDCNDSIVGARFEDKNGIPRHVITYCLETDVLTSAINKIIEAISIFRYSFGKEVNSTNFDLLNKRSFNGSQVLGVTAFKQIVADCCEIERIGVFKNDTKIMDRAFVSFFDTKENIDDILRSFSIEPDSLIKDGDHSFLLSKEQYEAISQTAPFLISMAAKDIVPLVEQERMAPGEKENYEIEEPKGNEPIIGVIDGPFDTNAYFGKWVFYHSSYGIEENKLSAEERAHGTEVDSILVDLARKNPDLDDGCGRFRVAHFAITSGVFCSVMEALSKIKMIVEANEAIKVWNISFGSDYEINNNFISPIASLLDNLQYEHKGIIFIVCGTNKKGNSAVKYIGEPADSLNSLVVNSVKGDQTPASYSRTGPALSFFVKPDIAYYGGDEGEELSVFNGFRYIKKSGTSFAAPLIARKMAFLMETMHMKRECAKALIIDSALSFKPDETKLRPYIGHGTVPISIKDVVEGKNNEIRFFLEGDAKMYKTYCYQIPVPLDSNGYHYLARATMCYFPKCSRNEGVDYTNDELSFGFGRVRGEGLKDVRQEEDFEPTAMPEKAIREEYRKWDNVKIAMDIAKSRFVPRAKFEGNDNWGFEITRAERLSSKRDASIHFGIVVTLFNFDNKNRIDEFIMKCERLAWLVDKVTVETMIDLQNEVSQSIVLK